MTLAAYRIGLHHGAWGVEHDGQMTGPYDTREAAFEAAIGPASNAIKQGYAVSITIEGIGKHEGTLGTN